MKDEDIKLPLTPNPGHFLGGFLHSQLRKYAREAVRLNMPNYGPSIDEEKHSMRMSAKDGKGAAAIKTLESLGYTYNGGELWKPPLGKKPDHITSEPLPFDLEKAKAGHPLVTRDGRKARLFGYAEELEDGFRLVALVDGQESVASFYDSGTLLNFEHSSYDLFLAPPEPKKMRTVWANYYPNGSLVCCYPSRDMALESVCRSATKAAVEIQIPEAPL